ncbi:MAG: hypothetical protein KAT54_02385, partial [Candidatus Marinimicrobia bacterium]|nr:hypothetical protein [Candidatus Neomarinimicrobiota bacterium]
IDVSRTILSLYMDIFNLFNNQNVEWLGSSYYYQIGESEGDAAVVRLDGVTGDPIRNPQVYNYERQFRFGISIQF